MRSGVRPTQLLRRTPRLGRLPDRYSFYCVTCDEWKKATRLSKHGRKLQFLAAMQRCRNLISFYKSVFLAQELSRTRATPEIQREWLMSPQTSLKTPHTACAALVLVAIGVSLGAQSAAAASVDQRKLARPHHHHHHHLYAMYRRTYFAPPAALPYAPEYGFLRQATKRDTAGPYR